ncbi:MAG: hypothetical protein ACFFCW_06715 [Candidatus Hodarchaeota archaeon]
MVNIQTCRGRALFAQSDGTLFRSLHFDIYCSKDDGRTWQCILSIHRSRRRQVVEKSRLVCRLLRQEVRGFIPLAGGGFVASTRNGVNWAPPGNISMQPSIIDTGRTSVKWPMNICADLRGRVLWGEYWGNPKRRSVRIFASDDGGRTFHIVHTFAAGETRHVHNILFDQELDKFWVMCGDHDSDPGVGLLDSDFRNFEWVVKGRQEYRTVCAFNLGKQIVYATDTEMEANGIHVLDKTTGKVEKIAEIDGSCIYATRCGKYYVISTTAEPLKGQADTTNAGIASIWISSDAYTWRRVYRVKKDIWSYKYFQFGSLVLPRGVSNREVLMFSGQALRGIDGKIFTFELEDNENY